jgi:TonB family protein
LKLVPVFVLVAAITGISINADSPKQKTEDDKVYDLGDGIQPPKLIHVVEPEFDPKSEEAFSSGVVRIQLIVSAEGVVRDPKVVAGINERQDQKAIEAVKQWRFKPGLRESKPVNVRVTVEVNFHLL